MSKIEWKQYSSGSMGNDFSQAETQKFVDDNFTHVTREDIQNVVDHPADDNHPHVKVVFEMLDIPRDQVFEQLGFQTLLNRVKGTMSLAIAYENEDREVMPDCRRQQRILEQNQTFRFLKISDYGTTGVDGAQVYDPRARDGRNNFKAMVFDLGGGNQSATGAGGHGLGKLANVASSQLSTVFFSTVNKTGSLCAGICINYQTEDENQQNLGKIASFVKRESPNTYDVNEVVTFLTQEEAGLLNPDLFVRTEIGTDIIIVEPKIIDAEAGWKEKILANCIINFPIAILEGTLEAVVGGEELNATNIEQKVQDLIPIFSSSIKRDLEKTVEFIKAYKRTGGNVNSRKITGKLQGFGEVELYLYKDADVSANQIAFFRKQGMSLQPYKSNAYESNYAGVLIVRGEEGNIFLRSIELADHQTFGGRSALEGITDQEVKNRKKRLYDWIDAAIADFTKIEARGRLPLKGLDKFIFIPTGANDGDETEDLGVKPQDLGTKRKLRPNDKKKKIISEKLKVEESETEGEEGEILIHVRHDPIPKPPTPGPHPGPTPKPTNVVPNPDSPFEGRTISKGIKLKETVLSAGSKTTFITLQAKPGIDTFNLSLKAVGEDDTESDTIPAITSAIDIETGALLTVQDGAIYGIENNGPKIIKIEFEKDPESRLDVIPFIDVPAPAGYSEPEIETEEDEEDE